MEKKEEEKRCISLQSIAGAPNGRSLDLLGEKNQSIEISNTVT